METREEEIERKEKMEERGEATMIWGDGEKRRGVIGEQENGEVEDEIGEVEEVEMRVGGNERRQE